MIIDIIYRCPECGKLDWANEKFICASCEAQMKIVSRSEVSINNHTAPISYWYKKIKSFAVPKTPEGYILKSKSVQLSDEAFDAGYKSFSGINAVLYKRRALDKGQLTLYPDRLEFAGSSLTRTIPFDTISSFTIESNTIILVPKKETALFFDFLEESGKQWEDLIKQAIQEYFAPEAIMEFHPRIRFLSDLKKKTSRASGHTALRVPTQQWIANEHPLSHTILKRLGKFLVKTIIPLNIEGEENIPESGPAIMMPNHESFMDGVTLGVIFKRNIWFMGKNSEFKHFYIRPLMKLAGAFPVRRYATDVQAIRNAIRIVNQEHVLGIFPEGERTWDGELLPLKIGTMRLALALGVPVIPVGISGSYELLPRWESKIQRSPVTIRIGKPIPVSKIPISKQTQHDIEEISNTIKTKIKELLDK